MPVAALVLAAVLAGCPNEKGQATPAEPCSRVGQRCEVEPGKLGSCVRRDDCSGDACFQCQSQH
jgi:hypothetical protein